jgi:hypothetical protein
MNLRLSSILLHSTRSVGTIYQHQVAKYPAAVLSTSLDFPTDNLFTIVTNTSLLLKSQSRTSLVLHPIHQVPNHFFFSQNPKPESQKQRLEVELNTTSSKDEPNNNAANKQVSTLQKVADSLWDLKAQPILSIVTMVALAAHLIYLIETRDMKMKEPTEEEKMVRRVLIKAWMKSSERRRKGEVFLVSNHEFQAWVKDGERK